MEAIQYPIRGDEATVKGALGEEGKHSVVIRYSNQELSGVCKVLLKSTLKEALCIFLADL